MNIYQAFITIEVYDAKLHLVSNVALLARINPSFSPAFCSRWEDDAVVISMHRKIYASVGLTRSQRRLYTVESIDEHVCFVGLFLHKIIKHRARKKLDRKRMLIVQQLHPLIDSLHHIVHTYL